MFSTPTNSVTWRNELQYEEKDYGGTDATTTVLPLTYDDYYKNSPDLTEMHYYLLGVGGMCLCVFGVFANVIAVPIFNMHNVLSSPTTYLTAISITDTITLFCGVSLLVTMRMWPREVDQVRMYKKFTGYFVPIGQPIFECAEMCSVYLTVALLIERFQYIRHGFYVRVLCTKQTTRRVLIAICVFCLLYNFPKVFQYKAETYLAFRPQTTNRTTQSLSFAAVSSSILNQTNRDQAVNPSQNVRSVRANDLNDNIDYSAAEQTSQGQRSSAYPHTTTSASSAKGEWYVRVMRTEVGRNPVFKDIYGSLLRVPVEMFIPYLLLGLFCSVIAANVFESGMHQNVAASRTNLVGDMECPDTDRSTVADSPAQATTDSDSDSDDDQPTAKDSSSAEGTKADVAGIDRHASEFDARASRPKRNSRTSFKPKRTEKFDVAELKEQVNTVMAMYVAMLTVACKLPQFLHTMLVSEQERFGVAPLTLVRFGSVVHFLALANASLKFVVYVSAGRHFREAFRTLICVTAQSACPSICPPSRAVSTSRASSAACSSLPTDLADVATDSDFRSQPNVHSTGTSNQREEVRLNIVAEDPRRNQTSLNNVGGSLSDPCSYSPAAPTVGTVYSNIARTRTAGHTSFGTGAREEAHATELVALRDEQTNANLDTGSTAFGASKC